MAIHLPWLQSVCRTGHVRWQVPQNSQHDPALLLLKAVNLQPCTVCDLCSAGYSPSPSAAANADPRNDKQ